MIQDLLSWWWVGPGDHTMEAGLGNLLTVILLARTPYVGAWLIIIYDAPLLQRVNFSCIEISECSSTSFSLFPSIVPFLMCSTVDNVTSKTSWYWGETCPVLVFNNRAAEPEWNGDSPMYTTVLDLGSHLGSPASPPCSKSYRTMTGHSQVW